MATYEGLGLCTPIEYQEAFGARLEREQLTRGELYVARFKIEGLKVGFRILGRVGLETFAADQDAMDYQLLNDDLVPFEITPGGKMIDGVWNSTQGIVYRHPEGRKEYDLQDGCFALYEGGDGWNMNELYSIDFARQIELTDSSQLVTHSV